MGNRLKDKVALVSGAGSSGPGWGNGKATAVTFAREGAKIFSVDISEAAAEETKTIIEGEGGECQVYQVDVSKSEEVQAMVNRCIEVYGRIDILQNNVGIVEVGGAIDASEESWDRVVDVNLKSQFLTCKYVLPHMVRQGGGVITNMSSIAGIQYSGVPYISYYATKAGILGLTRGIALEFADKNIRANSILPGLMNTPMIMEPLKRTYADGDVEKMLKIRDEQCPMKKMGDAWDVASVALFLASNDAKYITGAELVVDGGITCRFA